VVPGWSPDTEGRRTLSAGRREEVEASTGGGFGQVEAKIGVAEGDGEAGKDALVDAGLAGAEEAAQLVSAVAYRVARAIVQCGDERGKIVGGDKAGQAGGGE